jgi:hypothetical protein
MIFAEIAGYTYKAELKCRECTYTYALVALHDMGYNPPGITAWTVEGLLNALAALEGVDREYVDSEDFPVPFSGQQAEHDAGWAAHEGETPPRCQCGNDFLGEF